MKKVLFVLFLFTCINSGIAQFIPNGSFEESPVEPGIGWVGATGSTINGWYITDYIDYIGGLWTASEGQRSIDMNAGDSGSISCVLNTEVGRYYEIAFDLAGNFTCPPYNKILQVSAADQIVHYSFDASGYSYFNMGWQTEVFSFIALETETILKFSSQTPGPCGAALDNVRLIEHDCDNLANGITSVEEDIVSCNGAGNGTISLTVMGGTGSFSYTWENNGDTLANETALLTGLTEGIYNYTVTDQATLCEFEGTVEFVYTQGPDCNIYTVQLPTTCDAADGYLSLCTVEPGYEVLWNTGSTSVDLPDVGSGEYTVTITSPSGCASTCSTTLTASNSLGDFVWYDIDENGQQDAGEEGIQGIEISLHEVNNGFISSTISNADGYYLFEGLLPGAYYVTVESQIDFDMDFTFFNGGGNGSLDSDIDPNTGKSDPVFIYGGICHEDLDIGFKPLCIELDFGGTIGYDQVLCGTGNVPDMLVELSPATGSLSNLEYVWMYSYNYTTINNGTWYPITSSNSPNFQPPSTDVTMYFIRCVRPEGCENFLESNVIEVYADPSVHATFYGPSYSCVNETETISAVDVGQGATYEWYLNDIALNLPPTTLSFNQLISQAGINEIRMVVTKGDCVVESTDLFYVFDDPDQCNPLTPLLEDDNETIHTDSSLGMIDFSIIPNLVQTEQVKLSFKGFKWSEVNELQVLSMEGKTQQYDINQESEEVLSIQLDDFGSGIYMINIFLGDGTQLNKKFIVQD